MPGPVGQRIVDMEPEPSSHTGVLRFEHRKIWEDAEVQELGELRTNGAFIVDTGPRGCSPIGAKRVYEWKTNEFAQVIKTKARLIAKRLSRKPDVDVDELFAPTPSSLSIR